jgi:L-lactate dehydrogenase
LLTSKSSGPQRSILTVCTPIGKIIGVCDVTISLPHLIGGQGTLARFPLPLSDEEQARLHASAEIVCQVIEDLDTEMAK